MVQTCCEAVKSLKNHKNCWWTLELDVPSCQSWKIWKIHAGSPPGHPLPAKTLMGAPRAINLGGDVSILIFWPKTISFPMVMHKKATKTLWFVLKTQVESVFFLKNDPKWPKMTQNDQKWEKTLILPGFLKQTTGFWWLFYA